MNRSLPLDYSNMHDAVYMHKMSNVNFLTYIPKLNANLLWVSQMIVKHNCRIKPLTVI